MADDSPRATIATRVSAPVFWVVLAAFLAASIVLARINQAPGSPDSIGNLASARNIAQGRGFVSNAAGSLWVRQAFPAPETVRPPGLPYLLAALYSVCGVSLAVPVLVNAAAVALNALALRGAIRRSGGRWAGDAAGLLIILSCDYEMVSIWNNNILAACTSVLLLLAARPDEERDRPRPPWLTAALAACAAVGSLMKPTFLLSALPFGCLILATDPGKTRARRGWDVFVFLTLFLALTAVYWGRNLVLYGEPFYAPSFTSSRLAQRYGVLGPGLWRTVRFGRPMTYGEVYRRLGLANMLLVDAKMMAKTVFYAICMNPAVAVIASGLVLVGRPDRGRDVAGPALLMAGVAFEVGVYNHHEFRYLWPMYPCLLFLAWLTVRDYGRWGRGQATPLLDARFRRAFVLLGLGAVLIGGLGALEAWRQAIRTARQPVPPWVASVRALSPSAVVLTSDVPSVAWWTDRKAVICPVGPRGDLAAVIGAYKADHYLALDADERPGGQGVAWRPEDLTPLDRGEGWALYRITGPILDEAGARPSGRIP